MLQHVEGVGHSEGFGDDHGGIHRACSSVEDGRLVDVACFGRGTDHGDHAVVVLGVGQADEVGDEVGNVLPVLGGVLDDTEFEGAVEVQRQAVLERLFTEQHVTLQEVAGDGVLESR